MRVFLLFRANKKAIKTSPEGNEEAPEEVSSSDESEKQSSESEDSAETEDR